MTTTTTTPVPTAADDIAEADQWVALANSDNPVTAGLCRQWIQTYAVLSIAKSLDRIANGPGVTA